MKITDVMTQDAVCIRPDATIQEAAGQMKKLDVGALPVCDNDRLAGMITDRDITIRSVAEGHDPRSDRVRDVMTPELVYVFEDQDANEAARLMRQKQIRRLPVLNREKRLVGIISLGDLAVETQNEQLAGATLEAISEPGRPNR
ncbi:MAG: CBS domain-containing protein [Planctomycetia bacterium]|nr:CBS domain-containing protein [Planctomycetia bacterium]